MASKSKKTSDAARLEAFDALDETLERLSKELSELADITPPKTARMKPKRAPGRFKGSLVVGPQFFEPLTEDELKEFAAE